MSDTNEKKTVENDPNSEDPKGIGKPQKFMGKLSWGILALGLVILGFALNLVVGKGAPISEYLILFAKHSVSLVVIPLVLSYVVWVSTKCNKTLSGIVYYIAFIATFGWILAQEVSSPQNFKTFGSFVKNRYDLQKKYDLAKKENKKTDELVQKIFLVNSNYLAQMSSQSDGAQKELFQNILTFTSLKHENSAKLSELEKSIFTDTFVNYPDLRENTQAQEKIKIINEYLTTIESLRRNSEAFKEFFGEDKSDGILLKRMELRFLFEKVILPHADSVNKLETYYLSCENFVTNLKKLILWTSENTDQWTYESDESAQPAKITIKLNSPEAENFFSALVNETEQGLKELNAATQRIMNPSSENSNQSGDAESKKDNPAE